MYLQALASVTMLVVAGWLARWQWGKLRHTVTDIHKRIDGIGVEMEKIERRMAEMSQMLLLMKKLLRRQHLEQLLCEWYKRGGWVHGDPSPEVWELVPGWNLLAGKPREDN